MGGVNAFIPPDIDRHLLRGSLRDDPAVFEDAMIRVWTLIEARLKERLDKFADAGHDTVDEVLALTPSGFDAYLQILQKALEES